MKKQNEKIKYLIISLIFLIILSTIIPSIQGNISIEKLEKESPILKNTNELVIIFEDEGSGYYSTYEGESLFFEITAYWHPTTEWYDICLWAENLPPGASFPMVTGYDEVSGNFDWGPNFCQFGTYIIDFYATDFYDDPIEIFHYPVTVQVLNSNRPPTIEADPAGPINVIAGENLHIDLYIDDPDSYECGDDYPTLSVENNPGGAYNQLSDTYGIFDWQTNHEDIGSYEITFIVEDYYNEFDYCYVEIIVIPEDSIPPVTVIAFEEPKYFKEEYPTEGIWYVTTQTPFYLDAQDDPEGSGVAASFYRIWYDNSPTEWYEYNDQPFYLEYDGEHLIEYYSIDYADNVEEIQTEGYCVDTAEPIVCLKKEPAHINDFAFICVGNDDKWSFTLQGLQAYFTLIKHGYPADHIMLIFPDDGLTVSLDTIIERLNTLKEGDKPAFSTYGSIIKKWIDEMNSSKQNTCKYSAWKDDPSKHGGEKKWCDFVAYRLQKFSERIIKHVTKKPGKINVTFHFVDHGDRGNKAFVLKDASMIKREDFWSVYIEDFEDELKENDIECQNMLFLLDFCYSGSFLEYGRIPNPSNKIIVASSAKGLSSLYGNKGSLFFRPFWNQLDAGKSIWDAFKFAKSKIPAQQPQIKNNTGKADLKLFKKESASDKTSFDFLGFDEIGGQYFGDDSEYMPVGIDYQMYRVDMGYWIVYDNSPFDILDEGSHIVECYAVDLLGNTGDIDEYHVFTDNTPPGIPLIIYPTYSKSDVSDTPTFNWTDIEDISHSYYTLQIGKDPSFSNIVYYQENILGSSFSIKKEEKLAYGTYYWRVLTIDGVNNSGNWSEINSFQVTYENSAPDNPNILSGSTIGFAENEYNYQISSVDIDNDQIQYYIEWGDGTYEWTYWQNSGEIVNISHNWTSSGIYNITIKSCDTGEHMSNWSEPLTVYIYLEGMESYWKFDEDSGLIAYDSLSKNNGTINGATRIIGKVNNALSFDGVDDSVFTLNNIFSESDFINDGTLEAWVKAEPMLTKTAIVDIEGVKSLGTDENGYLRCHVNGHDSQTSSFMIQDGLWHHVAMTFYASDNLTLYVDGWEVFSAYDIGFHWDLDSLDRPIGIGSHSTYLHFFKGIIDEAAIYTRCLSPDEVLDHFYRGIAGVGYIDDDPWAPYLCGDADNSSFVDIDDVVYLISYIFAGGPAPIPRYCVGDADGSGFVDIDDVVYLISYIFAGGSAPVSYCCE